MKILLCGYDGAMGKVFSKHYEVAYGFSKSKQKTDYPITDNLYDFHDPVDVIVDFSHPHLFEEITDYARRTKTALVMATTGLSQAQLDTLNDLSKTIPVLQSGNFSKSLNVMTYLVEQAAKLLPDFDVEIIEKHHRYKVDAPSGSAKMLFEAVQSVNKDLSMSSDRNHKRLKNEVGMLSLRGGTLPGEHAVVFLGEDEVFELKHQAQSKDIFAHGAFEACVYVLKQKPGRYTYKDVIFHD